MTETIYWEDDFDGAVAQIVRAGERMGDGQTDRFILRLSETVTDLRAEVERLNRLVSVLGRALREAREWVSDDDPTWEVPKRIDAALALAAREK